MASTRADAVDRWSAAIREVEILEPWLTESHWDKDYWKGEASRVVEIAGLEPTGPEARAALAAALQEAFPTAELKSDNGFFLDHLDRRLDLIVALACDVTEEDDAVAARRALIDGVAADEWRAAREGFGDPDLASE